MECKWLSRTPKRQMFVVEMEHLDAFLQQIRVMELMHGVHDMPSLQALQRARLDGYALKLRIDVHGGIPDHKMRKLLELFYLFDGPLNEVRIQGCDEGSNIRAIERSIAMPSDTAGSGAFLEYVVHMLHNKKSYARLASSICTQLACTLGDETLLSLISSMNWRTSFVEAWSSSPSDNRDVVLFLMAVSGTAQID